MTFNVYFESCAFIIFMSCPVPEVDTCPWIDPSFSKPS